MTSEKIKKVAVIGSGVMGMEMYKPYPLLEDYVSRGWTSRKAGRGFYK